MVEICFALHIDMEPLRWRRPKPNTGTAARRVIARTAELRSTEYVQRQPLRKVEARGPEKSFKAASHSERSRQGAPKSPLKIVWLNRGLKERGRYEDSFRFTAGTCARSRHY